MDSKIKNVAMQFAAFEENYNFYSKLASISCCAFFVATTKIIQLVFIVK